MSNINFKEMYNKISILLFNILKSAKLKSDMRMTESFKKIVITEINNLFALELDFDIVVDDNKKLSMIFAQLFVNELGSEQKIEKSDNIDLDIITNNYNQALEYINKNFVDIKFNERLDNSNFNDINQKTLLQCVKINEDPKNILDNNNQNNNTNFTKSNPKIEESNTTTNSNANNANNANYSNTMNNANFMQNNLGMPKHPMMDPRFYPYKTKPKWMPLYKKILFFMLLFFMVSSFIFYLYAFLNQYTFNIFKSNDGNTYFPSSGKAHNTTIVVKLSISGYTSLFPILLLLFVIVMYGVTIYSKRKMRRDDYHFNNVISVITFAIIIYSVIQLITFAIPSLYGNRISGWLNKLPWDSHAFPTPGGISKSKWISNEVNNIIGSTSYKVSQIFAIIFSIVGLFIIGNLIFSFITNPRIDHQKMQFANNEYQKLIAAKFKGQEYKVDPKLFDNDLLEKKK